MNTWKEISLVIRETEIKTTTRHYFTPIRMAKIKTENTKCCGISETSGTLMLWVGTKNGTPLNSSL